jgi:hypothetical protein
VLEGVVSEEKWVTKGGIRAGSGGADADDGEEAAGLEAFLAVAEEEIAAACGAEIADKDVLFGEAGGEELGAVGFAKIEVDALGGRLVAGGHHAKPLKRVGLIAGAEFVEPFGGIRKLGKIGGRNFGANFVATAADRRAKRGEQIGGLGGEFHLQFSNGFCDDALQSAAPARVDGGYSSFSGIDEKNRNTVGGLDAEKKSGSVCDRGVTTARVSWSCIEHVDDVGVKLFQGDESKIRCAERREETTAIFQNIFAGVTFGETEIEDLFCFFLGD